LQLEREQVRVIMAYEYVLRNFWGKHAAELTAEVLG
jgi:hypothetical protein